MKKRAIALLVTLTFFCLCMYESVMASEIVFQSSIVSSEGWALYYTLDSDGVLTISGEAPILDYDYYGAMLSPWAKNGDIHTIVIEEGVTRIGRCAFFDCDGLGRVFIPDSVTEIASDAFSGCSGYLTFIYHGDAPEISFYYGDGINAVAYYPGDNETWIGETVNPYHGTVTWHPYEIKNAVEATCTEQGYTGDLVSGNVTIETGTLTAQTGHSWGLPAYEWSEDYAHLTATRVCMNDANHVETETVSTTIEMTRAATNTIEGEQFVRSDAFDDPAFEAQETTAIIPALGVTISGVTGCETVGTATLYKDGVPIQSESIINGEFSMSGLETGAYLLVVRHSGYYAKSISVEIVRGVELYPSMDFQLILRGDINGAENPLHPDAGKVSVLDLQRLFEHLCGIDPFESQELLFAADVDGDTMVNILDYQMLYNLIVE